MINQILGELYWSDLKESVNKMGYGNHLYMFRNGSSENLNEFEIYDLFYNSPQTEQTDARMIKISKQKLASLIKNSFEEIDLFLTENSFNDNYQRIVSEQAPRPVKQLAKEICKEIEDKLKATLDLRVKYEAYKLLLEQSPYTKASELLDLKKKVEEIIHD